MCDRRLRKILVFFKQRQYNVNFKLLDQILSQTLIHRATSAFNCLVRAYSKSPTPINAILAYKYISRTGSICPDNCTYPALLSACSRISSVPNGKQVHAHVTKRGLDCDIFVRNALLHLYGSVALLTDARYLFDTMPKRDVASWNSLMCVYHANSCSPIEVLVLFKKLMRECIRADKITMVILLAAFARAQIDEKVGYGKAVHAYVIKVGLGCILNVNNALLDAYTKCKQMDAAFKVFCEMGSRRDVVSYTILINGRVEMASVDLARDVFDQIADKDRVLWNLMVHAYVKAKRPKDALELFKTMDNEGVMPDETTMVSVLAACASLSDLQCGRLLHQFIMRNNIRRDVFLKTALIDMYSKCGSLEESLITFYKMEYKDVFTWTTMIEGLANNGYGNEALSILNQMEEQGIQPNEATFVSVLKACSRSGLVNEGCKLFTRMVEAYKLQPKIEHFGCLVDILSRAGLLHQANEFIKFLRPQERLVAYKTLLSACIKYSEPDIGEKVANEITMLSSQSHEAHILLSNFYALAGQWPQVAKTRRIIKEFNSRKEPGISSLELKPMF